MQVKCIINNVDDIANTELREELKKYINLPGGDNTLAIGKEYIVQCIAFYENSWYYYLHTDETDHYPWSYPAEFFVVIDNSLPAGWKIKFINREGMLKLERISFPAWVDDDNFFEKLFEYDDPDAMLAYITNLEQTQYQFEEEKPPRYSARIFGCELAKKLVEEPFNSDLIVKWCEQLYQKCQSECDDLLELIIGRLSIMDTPGLSYTKERLQGIASGLTHKFRVVEPEQALFSLNDPVSIKKNAPTTYRPGEQGVLCWIQEIDSEENATLFAHDIGSEVYFVRFQDGEVLEIPKHVLIKHDLFKK